MPDKQKQHDLISVMDYGQYRRARKLVHECCNYDILRIAGETDINFKKDRSNQKYAYDKKLIKSSEFSNEDSGRRKGVFYCFETGLLHILFCIGIIRIAMQFRKNKNIYFHAYVEQHFQEEKVNYLFVDEVQMCPKFELAINSLYSKGKYDIYITGSNAFLLSADLATLFTGRYIEIHVFPFSFQEYCQYYDETGDKEKLFDEYSTKGGLAGSYAYRTERDRIDYIKEVYETIVTRDLVQKYSLPDTLVLQKLCEFLMDNISNLTSPNKTSQLLTANKTTTNHVTVGRYMKYLCNAFVFYDIKRYDIRGKKYLESSEKFYLCDTGIRYAILGNRNMDYGRVYENMVCIELLRRGYDVYVGKLYQKEIDFVAQKGSEKIYIQVRDNISDQNTLERECLPLLQIRDAYPKKIIARTRHPKYGYEGIEIYNIVDWLLQEEENDDI